MSADQPDSASLWAVHIGGPDDIIPAPSEAEATAACVLLNAAYKRLPPVCGVTLEATAVPWPYSADAHKAQRLQFALMLGANLQVSF